MGGLLRGLVLRRMARHRVRALLAALAVAMGVAAFLGTHAVGRSVAAASTAVVRRVAGSVALSVEGADVGVPAAIAVELRALPGVRAAAPLVVGWLRSPDARAGRMLVLGIDPVEEPRLERLGRDTAADGSLTLADPLAFLSGTGAIVTEPLAAELGVSVGERFTVQGVAGARDLVVVAVVAAEGAQAAASGRVVVLALGGAQSLLGRGGLADRIDLGLAPGADTDGVAAAAQDVLAGAGLSGARVGPPRTQDGTAEDVLAILSIGLDIGALVSLFIGVFLIHHTLAVGVAERRREVGILRALGATRRQIAAVFCAEALILGGAGAVLGVGLAYAMAQTALQGFAATLSGIYFGGVAPEVDIPLADALAGIGVGLVVAVVAAVIPAGRAAREAPSDAIRRGPLERPIGTGGRIVRFTIAAVGCALTTVLVLRPSASGGFIVWVSTLAPLAAFLALAPYILVVAGRFLAPLLAAVGGVPGRLAADDLRRNPQRAALPAAALAVGLALVVETHGTVVSLSEETTRWMEQEIAGDLFVSSGQRVMGMGGHTPFEGGLRAAVAAVPGVEEAVGIRIRTVPWRQTRLMFLAVDMEDYRSMAQLDVRGRDRDEALALCATGTGCIVSENLVLAHGVDVGDRIAFDGLDGPFELDVVARFRDYSWPRGTVFLDRGVLAAHLDDRVIDQFSVKVAPGTDPAEVGRAIDDAIGKGRELVVTTAAGLRVAAERLLGDIFALSYAQVAVALAVAFMGVLNALWISVVLRRRELGLLRCVGATAGQITASVVLQGAALGVVGGILGVLGGAGIQWLALNRLMPAETGWTYPMRFPYAEAALVVLAGTATSALAAAFPARRAARTPIRDAIAYE